LHGSRTHGSARELAQAIHTCLDVSNAAPKAFSWSKTADDILAGV
jgi:hypothetical protein